jgi:hypothetical protein
MRFLVLGCTVAFVFFAGSAYPQTPTTSVQVSGRVIDADSQAPIAGVRVTVVPMRPPTSRSSPPTFTPLSVFMAVTDENGRFVVDGVTPGRHRVTMQKQGFAFDPLDAQTIDVTGGQAAVVDLVLRRGSAITGRILDERGEPLSDIRVMALRRVPGRGARMGSAGGPGMVTNDLGEFRIAGLVAGEYVLMAVSQPQSPFSAGPVSGSTAWALTYYPGTTDESAAQVVTVANSDTVNGIEFRLVSAPSFRVTGIAVDENGKPVADAMLMLSPIRDDNMQGGFAPPLSARSKPDGTFVIGGVIAGRYAITATPVIRSASGTGSFVSALSLSSSGAPTEQQIAVNAADVTGLKIVVPPPPR